MHGVRGFEEAAAVQGAQDRHDPAGAVHVLEMIRRRGGDLGEARHLARQAVDVGERETDRGFVCRRQRGSTDSSSC